MSKSSDNLNFQCPIPIRKYQEITMAHGSGGRLTKQLIDKIFRPLFDNPWLNQAHDGACLETKNGRLVMTTDSHVVKPLFFPGGDIGSLSVYGTVNDLAMCGAIPRYLSLGMIIEEGFSMELLWKIALSIKDAAEKSGIKIVTGDTKVIERHAESELFINTTGIGWVPEGVRIAPDQIRPGDAILLSGDIGRHGVAVLSARESLLTENEILSDCAPLSEIVQDCLSSNHPIHCMRDCTRGGLATALVELAETSRLHFKIEEDRIPVQESVEGACELLGLDPLYMANEGRFVLFAPGEFSDELVEAMQKHENGKEACRIGMVEDGMIGVTARNGFGGERLLELLTGDQLPRIC